MNRNAVSVFNVKLTLNERKKIIKSVSRNIVVSVIYPFDREFLFLVCNALDVGGENINTVWIVADAVEYHHFSAFTVKCGGNGSLSYRLCQ